MMWNYGYSNYSYPGMVWGSLVAGLSYLLVPILLWSIFWKGWALWKAAKNDSKPWFIALLILNTIGILDILYIFIFGKTDRKINRNSKRK